MNPLVTVGVHQGVRPGDQLGEGIVPLELGGSNAIANLFPEPGSGRANYHLKDGLENELHDLVCAGTLTLRGAQQGIAANWETLYRRVFGSAPGG